MNGINLVKAFKILNVTVFSLFLLINQRTDKERSLGID